MTSSASVDPRLGKVLAGKYEILRVLGVGGMGAVYEARHRFTRRRVAIKMLHAHTADSSDAAARFLQEAQAPSSIRHPGIVEVLDAGTDTDGSLYIALEFLEGEDLAHAMTRGAVDPLFVARVAWQMLEALAAAHELGFVHRDIKPQNIFIARDGRDGVRAKLLDFGIARQSDPKSSVHLTNTGAILGTPMYMSPEQARGERVDGRSDLWSLGATMFHALTGRAPFLGANYNLLIIEIVTTRPPSIAELRPDLHPALVDAIARALEPNLAMRWHDARAMADALTQLPGVRDALEFKFDPTRATASRSEPTPNVTPAEEAMLETVAATPSPDASRRDADTGPRDSAMVAPTSQGGATPTPFAWNASSPNAYGGPEEEPQVAGLTRSTRPSSSRTWLLVPAIALGAGIGTVAWWASHRTTPTARPVVATTDETPRAIAPASLALIANRRPTFRWQRPRGVEAVTLEVCRDRACADVVSRTYVSGDSGTLDRDLEPGHYAWRLRGLSQGRSAERTSAVWSFIVRAGNAAHAAVSGIVPDLDGDDSPELVLAAPRAETSLGAVLVYRSTPVGPSRTPLTLRGVDGANGRFGAAVSIASDVNGDGFADLVVGGPETFVRAGRAYVFDGGTAGLSREPAQTLHGIDEPESYFGESIAALGDANGDGFGDVAIGQWGIGSHAGRVLVFTGGANGLATNAAVTLQGAGDANEAFGGSIAGAGDVNGDGFGDLVVGARGTHDNAGRVYVFHGSASGISTQPAAVIEPVEEGEGVFGDVVASAGDVNGDGFADVAIAAPRAREVRGRVYLLLGSATGVSFTPAVTLSIEAAGARFGAAIAAGDVNGDGFDDLVVGADRVDERAGAACVFLGSATGIATQPAVVLHGADGAGGRFGASISVLGDVDRDGRADVVIGAPEARHGAGVAYLFRGSAAGIDAESGVAFANEALADANLGEATGGTR